MATFEFTAPDGKSYEVQGPEGATQEQAFSMLQQQIGAAPTASGGDTSGVPRVEVRGTADAAPSNWESATEKAKDVLGQVGDVVEGSRQGFRNLGAGAVRGAGSIGATLLAPYDMARDAMAGKGLSMESNRGRRAAMDEGLKSLGFDTDSMAYGAGKLGGEIAGTAGAGSLLAKGASAVPWLAKNAAPLIDAIRSSGMTAGGMSGLRSMPARIVGGTLSGGLQAGMADPETAGTGAIIGGALPPGAAVAGMVGRGLAAPIRSVLMPEDAKAARSILDIAGYKSPQQIAEVRSALTAQGPTILGEAPTVPQILQNTGVSQLQRTLRNAGEKSILEREALQEQARMGALSRVSPVTSTVRQSQENFGNALTQHVLPAEAAASKNVRAAYDAVDPFGETAFHLPIDEMKAAQGKYLGAGTFGTGSKAAEAVRTAEQVGQESLDAVAPAAASRSEPTLLQAVRKAGGIKADSISGKAFGGELKDLRQGSGMGGLINNRNGQSLDKLAEQMHLKGYIEDADPATLLNALRDPDLAGRASSGADADRVYQALREAGQGDAPGAVTIPKPVPFQTVQNLRSSLGEAADQAKTKGANKEAAALRQMVASIDERINAVAGGRGQAGENFPQDIVNQWRKANDLHADKMDRFRTGPLTSLFTRGGDGLPAAQGAELAPKFFSPRLSQSADIAAFRKVATPETEAALKNFAVTDAASQVDRLGNLSNSKYGNWMNARSGALSGLFGDGERATLDAVGKDLMRADLAHSLGIARGSATAQNIEGALGAGLLDNPFVGMLGKKIPVLGHFTGPALDALRRTAREGKVAQMSGLLADPAAMDSAIARYLAMSGRLGGPSPVSRLVYRSAPLLGSSQ